MTKDEVIKGLEQFIVDFKPFCGNKADWRRVYDALALLKASPKHGHWVKVGGYVTPGGDPVWKCSECGKGLHVYGIEHGTYGADVTDGQWVTCPNCGSWNVEEEPNG